MFIPQKIKPIIPMRLQYFGGEEPPEGGGTEPPAGGESKQQTQEPNTPPGGGEEKTFKQEDVNNVVAKETKKAQEKLLKQLGIEDFENAKEGMQKFKEWQDSQKTESEKQQERLTNLETSYNTTSEENTSLKLKLVP
ncbi:hypothetical protein [Thalassobacillus sp. C254]|uniref:hypothetical protein n=1 Tax=Thalassobacillus sp. C254 TaxID=1225341 RepID=UPI0022B7420D|nr:hypothetical protein [Thalassobacillus sp. C254]